MRPTSGRSLRWRLSWTCLLVGGFVAWTPTPSDGAAVQWRESVETSRQGVVQLDAVAGTMVVVGWQREQVEVSGTVGNRTGGSDTAEPLLERRGDRVVVRLDRARVLGTASHLEVRMPRGHRLELSGLSLDVSVEGLVGGIDLRVVAGTVRVRGAGGSGEAPSRVVLQTVSGVVRAEGSFDELEVHSVSGPVEIVAEVRRLTVESESGPQTLRVRDLERAELTSLDGPVYLDVESVAQRGVQVNARSFRGSLGLGVPKDSWLRVDAVVRAGNLRNHFGGREQRKSDDDGGMRLRLERGEGNAAGVRLKLSTFHGDIDLRPLG